MSWGEVKKINGNMSLPLNELLLKLFGGGYRQYIYENTAYRVPFDGTYTIRAFEGNSGAYAKVVRKLKKDEQLFIGMSGNSTLEIRSDLYDDNSFKMYLSKNVNVNSLGSEHKSGLFIGGGGYTNRFGGTEHGGNVNAHCNNVIAVGGGGSRTISDLYSIGDGGTVRVWGNNSFAIGGDGGDGVRYNSSCSSKYGEGGLAYVNDIEVTTVRSGSRDNVISGKGIPGVIRPSNSVLYGGSAWVLSSRGVSENFYNIQTGAGGRGGDSDGRRSNAGYGYFAGGRVTGTFYNNGINPGNGGFYGGWSEGNIYNNCYNCGKGGDSPFGIGGKGALNTDYYSNSCAPNGGYGKIKGGDGGTHRNNPSIGGYGGDGYIPGRSNDPNKQGHALTTNMLIGTLPRFDKNSNDSIVIIEYGDSPEDF